MLARSSPPFLVSVSWQSAQYSATMGRTAEAVRSGWFSAANDFSATNSGSIPKRVQGRIGIRMVTLASSLAGNAPNHELRFSSVHWLISYYARASQVIHYRAFPTPREDMFLPHCSCL